MRIFSCTICIPYLKMDVYIYIPIVYLVIVLFEEEFLQIKCFIFFIFYINCLSDEQLGNIFLPFSKLCLCSVDHFSHCKNPYLVDYFIFLVLVTIMFICAQSLLLLSFYESWFWFVFLVPLGAIINCLLNCL